MYADLRLLAQVEDEIKHFFQLPPEKRPGFIILSIGLVCTWCTIVTNRDLK